MTLLTDMHRLIGPDSTAEVHTFSDFNDAFHFVTGALPLALPTRVRRAIAHNFVFLFDDGLIDGWPYEIPPANAEPPEISIFEA